MHQLYHDKTITVIPLKNSILVCSGYHIRIAQSEWLKQQKLIFLKLKIGSSMKASRSCFFWGLLLVLKMATLLLCPHILCSAHTHFCSLSLLWEYSKLQWTKSLYYRSHFNFPFFLKNLTRNIMTFLGTWHWDFDIKFVRKAVRIPFHKRKHQTHSSLFHSRKLIRSIWSQRNNPHTFIISSFHQSSTHALLQRFPLKSE